MKNLRLAITKIINGGVEQYVECCHGLILADDILALLEKQGTAIASEARSGETVQQGSTETASTRADRHRPNSVGHLLHKRSD